MTETCHHFFTIHIWNAVFGDQGASTETFKLSSFQATEMVVFFNELSPLLAITVL